MAPLSEYAYGECRVMLGHHWERVGPVEPGKKTRGSWRVSALCERCGTRRRTLIDGRGNVTSRTYKQPKDYRLEREVKRASIRLATLIGWRKVK